MLVPLGKSVVRIPLLTKDSGGQLVNADSIPTVLNVQKNGVDAAEASITVSQLQDDTPSNITGNYVVSADLSATGLNVVANDDVIVTVQATVAGTLLTSTISFTMADMAGNAPTIELG